MPVPAGTRLELLPAGVAVGLASELLFRFSRLSGGIFLHRFGGRGGVEWWWGVGGEGGSRGRLSIKLGFMTLSSLA